MQTNAPATSEWVDQFNRAVTFRQIDIDQAALPAHAATHAVDGSDPVSAASIGASSYAVYTFTHASWSPGASGATGFMGFPVDVTPPTTAATREIIFPYSGTVIGAALVMSCSTGTVQGAGAAIGLWNKNTSSLVGNLFTTGIDYTATGGGLVSLTSTDLNLAVVANTDYAIRLTIPTFTSAPTSVKHGVYLFFR
jgi:hypothetical protein